MSQKTEETKGPKVGKSADEVKPATESKPDSKANAAPAKETTVEEKTTSTREPMAPSAVPENNPQPV